MARVNQLSAQDHALVTAAVSEAEKSTDGEIVTIVAPQSDAYHDVGLHWAVLAMLLAMATIAAFPDYYREWAIWALGGWHQEISERLFLTLVLGVLIAKFLAVRYILAIRALRMIFTPGATKARRVRRRAVLLFKTSAESRTAGRTGILLYLSLAEHRAEIVADEAIASKVAPEVWGDAMVALIDEVRAGRPGHGMAAAVKQVGIVLAQHFPKSADNPNELPDRLIEL